MVVDQDHEIIDKIVIQYFPKLPRDELLELLDKFKGQFNYKARRLKLLARKIQFAEDDTHRIAKEIHRMHEQLKPQTKTGSLPKLNVE